MSLAVSHKPTEKPEAPKHNSGPEKAHSTNQPDIISKVGDKEIAAIHEAKTTQTSNLKPVINLGHLKQFDSAEGENIGQVSLRDKKAGKNVKVDVVSSKQDDGQETYKLVADGKVIAFREIKIHIADAKNKKDSSKISLEFVAVKDPNRFGGVLKAFNGIVAQRMRELEAAKNIKFEGGAELNSSLGTAKRHREQGFEFKDESRRIDRSPKKCDAAIANKETQEISDCIMMYLPRSARKQWKAEINKAPIFDAKQNKDAQKDFTEGKVKLTKSDGTSIEAKVTKIHDEATKMDVFEIKNGEEVLGTVQVNYMKLNEKGEVQDQNTYDNASSLSRYGNSILGWGGKPTSKIFIEMHQVRNKEFKDLERALFQIPAEIALRDKTYGGRVTIEVRDQHKTIYEQGHFLTQKLVGPTKAADIEAAYQAEIKKPMPNLKNLGSHKMVMSREDMLAKFPNPLISSEGHKVEAQKESKDPHAASMHAHAA